MNLPLHNMILNDNVCRNADWQPAEFTAWNHDRQELSSCSDGWPCQSKVGQKVGGGAAVPRSMGELGPHLTQSCLPGPRPTSIPSGILIHPIHQCYKTDRQTDNGLITSGEPFYKRSPKTSRALGEAHYLCHITLKLAQHRNGQAAAYVC